MHHLPLTTRHVIRYVVVYIVYVKVSIFSMSWVHAREHGFPLVFVVMELVNQTISEPLSTLYELS